MDNDKELLEKAARATGLTEREAEVLRELAAWCAREELGARPMDIGATDASHHSATLRRLSEKGLVERKRRSTMCNVLWKSKRGSYRYHITAAGAAALAEKGEGGGNG